MESAVAVARSARALGDQSRVGPQNDQPGADARLLAPDGQYLPREFRILLAAAGAGVRSGARPQAPGRGRARAGLRCRGLLLRYLLRQYRRGRAEQPAGSRHPGETAPARTRRLLHGLLGEEAEEHRAARLRRLRQLRDASRGLRGERRLLCLWQLSRYRRGVRRAGRADGPRQARDDAASLATAGAREDDLCTDLAAA